MGKARRFVRNRKILYGIVKEAKDNLIKIKGLVGLGSYPDYIIIGAQKSGTSSLQYYLTQHSKIKAPLRKEIHYFDMKNHHKRGKKFYQGHFPHFKKKRNLLTGEATPEYMFFPKCAKRIKNLLPNVKLIIILRNPVDRAYSHYNMEMIKRRERLSFEEAIDKEKERIKKNERLINHSYLSRGKYVEQLKRYFKYFNKDKILILSFEEFKKNPQKETNKVFNFLGLKKEKIFPKIKYEGRYHSKMKPKTRRKLEKYFEPYNKELYDYLGRDFGW